MKSFCDAALVVVGEQAEDQPVGEEALARPHLGDDELRLAARRGDASS